MVQILDPKTSQALSLFLAQFKQQQLSEIAKGFINLNQRMFTAEQVKQVTSALPTKDDVSWLMFSSCH